MMVFHLEWSIATLVKNVIMEILGIGGLVVNLIFIVATIKYKHYRDRPGYLMMLSLALADIGNLVLICGHLALGLELGEAAETVMAYYNIVFWYSSLVHYVIIAVHRLYAVVDPIRVDVIFSVRSSICILGIGWLLSVFMACLPLTGVCCETVVSFDLFHDAHIETGANSSNLTAWEESEEREESKFEDRTNIWAIVAQTASALTLLALLYCYIRVYIRIRSIQVQNSRMIALSTGGRNVANTFLNQRATRRISYQFIVVSVVFSCILIVELLIQTGISRNSLTDEVLKYLFTLNSSCHPIVYALFTVELGNEMRSIIFCGKFSVTNTVAPSRSGGQQLFLPSVTR